MLDSNLLLLLVIGQWNPRAISTQKRLGGITVRDFDLLANFLGTFQRVVTTAHILTEVSNLAGTATGQTREAIFTQLSAVFPTLDERILPVAELCTRIEFRAFGITDAAMSILCSEMLLVTADGRLADHLQRKGLPAWTLQQVRDLRDQTNNA